MMRSKNWFCAVRIPLVLWLLFAFLSTGTAPGKNSARAQLPTETEARIRTVLSSPRLQGAHVGLSVLELGQARNPEEFPARRTDGKAYQILFEENAENRFMPASNMKLFTAAIALHLLGKERRFPTRAFLRGQEIELVGGGDPSFTVADLEKIADQIAEHPVNQVHSIIGDGSLFTGETGNRRFPYGWTIDDTQWYYGPAISALAIERNHFDLTISGGKQESENAALSAVSPLSDVLQLTGRVTTRKQKSDLEPISFLWETNRTLSVSGEISVNGKQSLGVAFPDPAEFAAAALRNMLKQRELLTDALASSRINPSDKSTSGTETSQKLAEHYSPRLEVLLLRLLKNSDNLYAEMLLRNAAVYHHQTTGNKANAQAHKLLKEWLKTEKINPDHLRFEDGSGLSRYNLLTPRATSELLVAINAMPDGDAIWNALPIAGVDGTLRNRMKNSSAAGNVRAKTGTLSIASNLSGYVTTRGNRRLAVSFYINFARDVQTMRWAQDAVFTALAESQH